MFLLFGIVFIVGLLILFLIAYACTSVIISSLCGCYSCYKSPNARTNGDVMQQSNVEIPPPYTIRYEVPMDQPV